MPRVNGRGVSRHQPCELVVTTHEGRWSGRLRSVERLHAVGPNTLLASLERELAEGAERDRAAAEPPCGVTDDDIAVARLLLQPGGDVHGVADDVGIVLSDDDLARIHCDAQTDP